MKFLFAAALAAGALNVSAIDFITTNVFTIATNTVVEEEQWIVAGLAQIDGTYKSDLHIITGNPLSLNGTFEGNVAAAASMEASVSGRIERNLRLAATTVRINGHIGGNLMAAADTLVLGTNAVISGDAIIFANSFVHEGAIEGDLDLTATRVATLAGTVEGDAEVSSQEILFPRGAEFKGDFHYVSAKEVVPEEGVVAGALVREPLPSPYALARLKRIGLWFVAALLAGIPFITLFPMTTAMAAQLVRRSPFKCFATGFLAFMAIPTIAMMAITSFVGVPLGSLMLAAWGILFYLSRFIMAIVIGTLILRSIGASISRVILSMILGLALIYAATIPAGPVALIAQSMVLWFGMGSLILALIEKRRLILQVPANLKKLETLRDEKFNPEEK